MLIFLLNLALACSPAQEFEISCKNYCWIDQGAPYFVKANKCFCGNEVDLSKHLIKVPRLPIPRQEKTIYKFSWEN